MSVTTLNHISKVWILPIRKIIESMHKLVVVRLPHTSLSKTFLFLVLVAQVPSQHDQDDYEKDVAAHVCGEGDKVTRFVSRQEHLRALQ
jgi:hypothetical protein